MKGREFESLQVRWENFLLQGQLSVLTLISVSVPARKRSRSFCQKCRWQVTAKHGYTLCMWICMKCHGAWLYGAHRTRRDGSSFMSHQPCHVESRASAVSLLESGEYRYIKAINNNNNNPEKEPARRQLMPDRNDRLSHWTPIFWDYACNSLTSRDQPRS